jgi:ankyrin repeat protein
MQSVHLHNTQQTERGDVDLRGGRMSENVFLTGNSSTLQSPNNCGVLPLHVACQHHDSINVIQYLLSLDAATLDALDIEGCTALHYTCRGAKYETITMLLETYGAVSVSKRNAHGKLPIDLLFESSEGLDRDRVEYIESVFRLLTLYPETLMNYNGNMKRPDATQNGKKRKLEAV